MLSWKNESEYIQSWLDSETEPLDVVQYWGQLVQVYDDLRFIDQIDDTTRIKLFKDVIREVNRLYARVRSKLAGCTDIDDCIEYLSSQFHPGSIQTVTSPKDIMFQSIKQVWIKQQIYNLQNIKEKLFTEEEVSDE